MNFFRRHNSVAGHESLFDALEPRLALYAAPFLADFPSIGEMSNQQNTVVRMQTSAGIIDIELFDRAGPDGAPPAPNTAQNFLRYIEEGHYDQTFFHRLVPGFVLQGGGFRLEPGGNLPAAIPAFDAIANEFNQARLNVEGTLAMARLGGQPNSATNQFFFNLDDNANLDTADGGFTVFGQVISGWDIVQAIGDFQRAAANQAPYNWGGAFGELPISQPITGGQITTNHLVTIVDIDVIKPATSPEFYQHSLYFPDGFRSGNTTSTVDLVNLDANTQTFYEIIARFETASRDRVVASGILVPGAKLSVPIHIAGDPSLAMVRGGTGFAYEVRATGPVAASLTHSDYSATTTQGFINPRDFDAEDLQDWHFAFGQKGTGLPSYLTWQNLSDQPAQVTITFTSEDGDTHSMVQTNGAFRRGGLNVNLITAVPNGAYSVQITSTQPIVAALSQYRTAPGRAAIETGILGAPATKGVLPGAIISENGASILSVALAQPPSAPVVIDFEFILANGTVLQSSGLFTLDAQNMRQDVDLFGAHGALPTDELFTIRYSVRDDAAPISASYVALVNGQTMRSSFQTASTKQVSIAGGYTNPALSGVNNAEFISIFNPHTSQDVAVNYRLRFHFVDDAGSPGTIIVPGGLGQGLIAPGQTIHIPVRNLTEIMDRINAGNQFRSYGITVTAEVSRNELESDGAVFVQYTRLDTEGRTATIVPILGTEFPSFFLTNPIFA